MEVKRLMKKASIGVILYGTKYLKESLPSLINQDYENIEFLFRDHEEGEYSAYKYIKKEMPEIFEKIKITKGKNLWHSGGHNALINKMTGDYYFCCSNDMLYPPDFVSNFMEAFKKNSKFTIATCKLRQWDYKKDRTTQIIDSCGIGITKNHHFFDIGQGEEDHGQYDHQKEIFGGSGALTVYSKEALESIRYNDEFYDNLMHYKNDVDLAYRLQWAGNKCLFLSDIVVYHDRQVDKRSKKPLWTKQSSFFGEKILMKKNFSKNYPFKIRLQTHLYHFLKTCYLLVTTPKLYKEYNKLRKTKLEIQEKKKHIQRNKRIKDLVKLMK